MHRGEILAFKAESGQHQVFYEDGEDEWVDLAAQHVASWQEPVRGVVTAPGLPEGLSHLCNLITPDLHAPLPCLIIF